MLCGSSDLRKSMDLLDRLLGHDAWTTRELLRVSGGLIDEQLDREFDIGHRTVRRTFQHIIRNMEVWSGMMVGEDLRAGGERAVGQSIGELTGRLDASAAKLARITRAVAARSGWDERWVDTLDEP